MPSREPGVAVTISGVAMSGNLQFHGPVLNADIKGIDGQVGGQGTGAAGAQVEQRPVAWAFDGAGVGIERTLGQRPVVVGAAILDREEVAVAVEHADLAAVDVDDARRARRKLRGRADIDCGGGFSQSSFALRCSPEFRVCYSGL